MESALTHGPPTTAPCFIDVLPDELLCLIFWFTTHRDRLACAWVCARWRTASLAAPGQLWRKVKSHNQIPGAFSGLLDRSRSAPVVVRVEVRNCNVREVGAALARHMHHVVSLLIHIDELLDVETSGPQLAAALAVPAPLLERFIVMDIFRTIVHGLAADRDAALFANSAPALAYFKLYGNVTFLQQPVLRGVRHLLVSTAAFMTMDAHAFQMCLHLFHDIETFGVQLLSWYDADDVETPLALPSSLRALVVTSESDDFNPVRVLRSLRLMSLPKLSVAFDAGCSHEIAYEVLQHVLDTLDSPFVDVTIDSSTYSELALIECRTRSGLEREFLDMPTALPPRMFAALVSLAISEWEWNDALVLPTAPALTHLTVRLVTPHYMAHDGHKSLFLDLFPTTPPRPRLRCPRLHTLTFSTRRRGDPALLGFEPALAPDMLRAFIELKIDSGRATVPVLCLNGVRLVDNIIDDVAALLALVDDLQWGPGHLTPDSDVQHLHDWK